MLTIVATPISWPAVGWPSAGQHDRGCECPVIRTWNAKLRTDVAVHSRVRMWSSANTEAVVGERGVEACSRQPCRLARRQFLHGKDVGVVTGQLGHGSRVGLAVAKVRRHRSNSRASWDGVAHV